MAADRRLSPDDLFSGGKLGGGGRARGAGGMADQMGAQQQRYQADGGQSPTPPGTVRRGEWLHRRRPDRRGHGTDSFAKYVNNASAFSFSLSLFLSLARSGGAPAERPAPAHHLKVDGDTGTTCSRAPR
ncbi:hypothetical protein [Nitrospira lenta]|uniref:hypothetical protein n=1 Tax=Nitrospira lenta TaxID=1436998 RepID=UPI001FED1930|nr:hypothetical protein [Nitrospira lenta]